MKVLYQILATSDLVLSIIWSIWSIVWLFAKERNEQACTVINMMFPFLHYTSVSSVMICLCGISLNLYLLVTKPLRYHTILTRKRFIFSLASMYLLTFVAHGIYLPIPNSPFIRGKIENCLGREFPTSIVYNLYNVLPVCVTLIFITMIYVRLLLIVRQKMKAVPNNLRIIRLNNTVKEVGVENGGGHGCQILDQPKNGIGVNPDEKLHRPPQARLKGFITVILVTGVLLHRVDTVHDSPHKSHLHPRLLYSKQHVGSAYNISAHQLRSKKTMLEICPF